MKSNKKSGNELVLCRWITLHQLLLITRICLALSNQKLSLND